MFSSLSLMKSWCEHDESLRKSTANFGLPRLIVYDTIQKTRWNSLNIKLFHCIFLLICVVICHCLEINKYTKKKNSLHKPGKVLYCRPTPAIEGHVKVLQLYVFNYTNVCVCGHVCDEKRDPSSFKKNPDKKHIFF